MTNLEKLRADKNFVDCTNCIYLETEIKFRHCEKFNCTCASDDGCRKGKQTV